MASPIDVALSAASQPERSLSASLSWISRLVSIVVLIATVMAIGGIGYLLIDPGFALRLFGPHVVTPLAQSARLPLFLALVPALILFLLTMSAVDTLFRRFRNGRVLDPDNARLLTNIGWYLFASAEVAILTRTLVVLALTWNNPPGQRQLIVSVSLNDLMLLLFGLFMLAFGKVIHEATRIADENRSFI